MPRIHRIRALATPMSKAVAPAQPAPSTAQLPPSGQFLKDTILMHAYVNIFWTNMHFKKALESHANNRDFILFWPLKDVRSTTLRPSLWRISSQNLSRPHLSRCCPQVLRMLKPVGLSFRGCWKDPKPLLLLKWRMVRKPRFPRPFS